MSYRNSERQIRNEWERSKPDAVCIVCGTISGNLEVIDLGIHGKLFDKWNVAFVSATQEINTHTPAKQMMLNILVTFAQFEREVITERVRDKMAASRRKGKWVGGTVPYAHRVEKRRSALTRMKRRSSTASSDVTWRCKSPKLIAMELNKESVFNHNGRKWDTQYIHRILTNHHYVGEVECQAQSIRGSMKASCPGPLGLLPQDHVGRRAEVRPLAKHQRPSPAAGHPALRSLPEHDDARTGETARAVVLPLPHLPAQSTAS